MNASLSKILAISKDSHASAQSLKELLQKEYDELSSLNSLAKDILATLFKITTDLKEGVNALRGGTK
jgi:hypothetical protein